MSRSYCIIGDEKLILAFLKTLEMSTVNPGIQLGSEEFNSKNLVSQLTYLYKLLFLYECFLDGWNIQTKNSKISMRGDKRKLDALIQILNS